MTSRQLISELRQFNYRWIRMLEAFEVGDYDELGSILVHAGEDFDIFIDTLESEGVTP